MLPSSGITVPNRLVKVRLASRSRSPETSFRAPNQPVTRLTKLGSHVRAPGWCGRWSAQREALPALRTLGQGRLGDNSYRQRPSVPRAPEPRGRFCHPSVEFTPRSGTMEALRSGYTHQRFRFGAAFGAHAAQSQWETVPAVCGWTLALGARFSPERTAPGKRQESRLLRRPYL